MRLQPTLRLSLKNRRKVSVPKEAREHAEQLWGAIVVHLVEQRLNRQVLLTLASESENPLLLVGKQMCKFCHCELCWYP